MYPIGDICYTAIMKPGTLHLIPSPIGSNTDVLAPYIRSILESVPYIIAENEKTVRRFLATQMSSELLAAKQFAILDEHTPFQDMPALLDPILAGQAERIGFDYLDQFKLKKQIEDFDEIESMFFGKHIAT